MKLPLYQVDAFAGEVFRGNPAAVVPLDQWLPDATLQAIAEENNLAETAYFVREGSHYRLRWFTPVTEVDLCGHATLASAWVLFERLAFPECSVSFETRSGRLTVERRGPELVMNFPAVPLDPIEPPPALLDGLGAKPLAVLGSMDYCCVFSSEAEIAGLRPNFLLLAGVRDRRGIIVTAPGDQHDFVSRFFAPAAGITEDPVTGSAHCALAPYWAARLGRTTLRARQISARGGEVGCRVLGDRVELSGVCAPYLEGSIEIR